MKNIFRFLTMVFCLSSLIFASSCDVNSTKDTEIISDTNFYTGLGAAMVNCYHDIYNQNLAGKPTGNQSKTATGPMGGSVIITGTTSQDEVHNITTANLILNMTNIKYTYTYGSTGNQVVAEITLTGSTGYSGSFSPTYTSLSYQASNLHVVGTVTYDGKVRDIDQTGSVIINHATNITVNIFGNTATW